jgi:hypothetical protein
MILDAAQLTRDPWPAEFVELQLAVMSYQGASGPAKAAAAQAAIDHVVKMFGIDLAHVTGRITFNANLTDQGQTDGATGIVQIGPKAFKNREELAATIVHEVTHANQAKLRGDAHEVSQRRFAYEVMAYSTAEHYAEKLRLGPETLKENKDLKEGFLKALTPANQAQLLANGEYWVFDPAEDKTVDPALMKQLGLMP